MSDPPLHDHDYAVRHAAHKQQEVSSCTAACMFVALVLKEPF